MKKLSIALIEITKMLSNGEYYDENIISEKLNITQGEVWQTIKKLKRYGIKLHSMKGRGYSLQSPLILLNEAHIKQGLQNKNIDITVFETIDSTNNYLKTFIGDQKIRVALSEHQTNGRGRLGRSWHSPFGCNLYFSCIYPFEKDINSLSGLSIVAGLAIVNSLKQFNLPGQLLLKWPNDVIYQDKKLAGTLIEIQSQANGVSNDFICFHQNVF
jgi:BirA family biotin operon repressor/biotin-[acetyl-CoA-carboxylase] ligase